jgi:cobalt/nickel transport system ATP-binding protein
VSRADLIFEARDLVYRYNEQVAIDGLSISVERGERLALLGANGSGKSTLLRLFDGLVFPESGRVSFCGEPVTQEKLSKTDFSFQFRRRVGMVFQNPDAQLFNPTVFDEIAFGPLQLRWNKSEIRDRVEAILQAMDIAHLRNRSPHRLSGGEKKRVAIASVMILDPEVLLLDEPTAALDPKSQTRIIDLLASFAGSGKTVITATHDLDSLEEISDRCVIFQQGTIAAEGEPLAIMHDLKLLEKTRIIQAHKHKHANGKLHPHAHVHIDETK